jgi:hypothetical protein
MEPLAIQSGVSQTVRPVLALDGSLTSILKEGRVVAGEVLQTLDGKSLLIGVGRHRVPAESHVEMQAGDRFLARVEHTEEGTVLRVLGGKQGSESQLLIALRNVVGQDKPVGELLGELARSLRAVIESAGDPDSRLVRLLKSVGEHIFQPGSTSEELQALLSRAGFKYEARLLAAVLNGGVPGGSGALVPELTSGLLAAWKAQIAAAGSFLGLEGFTGLERLAKDALQKFLGTLRLPTEVRGLADLVSSLGRALSSALESLPEGARREALLASIPGALSRLLGEGSPTRLGALLLAALGDSSTHSALTGNLKAQLLAVLEGMEPGAAREAVSRALAGIESEQLLNLARKEFQEGWHLSMPVPDGERWATAHFFYRDPAEGEGDDGSSGEALQRLTVTIDFTAMGPVRADFGIRTGLVALRLVVTRPEVETVIRERLDELTTHLAADDREVRVAVVLGTTEEAEVDSKNQNIRWLRENRLMDLSG